MQDTIDKFVIMFVDNEPARHALAKGFGKDDSINCLLQHAWRRIEDLSLTLCQAGRGRGSLLPPTLVTQ